jgi:uncharacterized membrane protein (DUF4010 family)
LVDQLTRWLPHDGVRIILALFLSFLLGLEREEHKPEHGSYVFGGVRTFPLIGLTGYALALISGSSLVPVATGFAVIGAFLCISYWNKLQKTESPGVTTEISGLTTYVIGALCAHDQFWIATTLAVISLLLLELKQALENLSRRIPANEIFTFTKFLLLTAVILPVLPNQNFGPFQFNPYKTWLVVAAVSAVSYASYILQLRTKEQAGILGSAILGGLYSSTVVTVVLAKRARDKNRPNLFSGAILIASSVMYLRLLILVAMFNATLAMKLVPSFLALTIAGTLAGWLWARRSESVGSAAQNDMAPANPLELGAALLFAVLFVALLVLTHYAAILLGSAGVYGVAILTGFTDVSPFVMGLTQTTGASISMTLAASAILVAAASNNVVKAGYAYAFADRQTGKMSLAMLLGLTICGLVPLIWILR